MKASTCLFYSVISVMTIKCYGNDSIPIGNRLVKRQIDDEIDDEENNENQSHKDRLRGKTNNGILFAPSGRIHSGILLPKTSSRVIGLSEPKTFESFMKTTKIKEESRKNKCRQYKPVDNFDFVLMADTWQIAYYISKDKIACFRISIQSTSPLKKKVWTEMYGNFNGTVKWSQCMFEMSSSDVDGSTVPQKNYDHRHFLQGSHKDGGVFDNVIIEQYPGKNATLVEQSPDQWLVYKGLLLMRDCDNGEVVVFSKVDLNKKHVQANITDIEEALTNFNEPTNTGVVACSAWKTDKFLTLS